MTLLPQASTGTGMRLTLGLVSILLHRWRRGLERSRSWDRLLAGGAPRTAR